MIFNEYSPYIRKATPSLVKEQHIGERIIFDFELLYVENGQVDLTMNGEKYVCPSGTAILLRPGVPHVLEFKGRDFISQPHIHFDTVYDELSEKVYVSFHRSINDIPKTEREYLRKDNMPEFPSPILNFSDKNKFNQLFFSIIKLFQEQKDWYIIDCKIKMLELLKMIISDNAENISFKKEDFVSGKDIPSIKNYIDSNYKNNITLESLENQFHYSRFYISKMFRKYYGISIMKYYDNLRIEAAKRYLKKGLSVSQITEKLNVSSIYSFSRFFKNKTGYSPTEYAKTDV